MALTETQQQALAAIADSPNVSQLVTLLDSLSEAGLQALMAAAQDAAKTQETAPLRHDVAVAEAAAEELSREFREARDAAVAPVNAQFDAEMNAALAAVETARAALAAAETAG